MVRPRLMQVMNNPTSGVQLVHQAQEKTVQPRSQAAIASPPVASVRAAISPRSEK